MQTPDTNNSTSFFGALRLGFTSMLKYPVLAAIFLVTTLTQGSLQGLIVFAFQGILSFFSEAENVTPVSLLIGTFIILVVWTLRALSTFFGEIYAARLAFRVQIDSMQQVLAKLLTLPVQFFDRNSQGDLIMASYQDLQGVRMVTTQVGKLMLYSMRLVGLGVAAAVISPRLALISFVIVPFGMLPAYWLGKRITNESRHERQTVQTLYDSFLQLPGGIRSIKVNRSESRIINKTHEIGRNLYRHIIQQVVKQGQSRLLLETVIGMGLAIMLIVGSSEIAAGRLDWASLLGLMIAITAVYAPVIGIINIYTSISKVIPNLDRVDKVMNELPFISDQPDAKALEKPPETIELRDVSFSYQDQNVLEGISLHVKRGETIGIVGPSGSGKSTLLSLLLRFYDPTEGAILLDGVDMRDVRHSDLMQLSAIVLQEPFLFIDTIAANIRIGRPEASMEEIVAAAQSANVHEEILQMDHGYETVLGRGVDARGVSGGQRQRICIASALLKNAPLLFLDEATSSLDSVSEKKVQDAIDHLMMGRTTFVIAHRLSTLRNADRIIVLERGKMVGIGTHEELLATCDTYQKLYAYQSTDGSVLNVAEQGQRHHNGMVVEEIDRLEG